MTTDSIYTFITIDDHPFTRNGIVAFISAHENFRFIGGFNDTRSVLNSNFTGKPDIIILDLNMPGMDGRRSCPLLKQKFPYCKIVAFTQYAGLDKELTGLGFDGYIVKSETDSLIEALISVLNGKKYFRKDNKHSSPERFKADESDTYLKIKQLTKREAEIAKFMLQDFSSREIAEKISIAESTVETHRKHIKEKLQAKSKHELYTILRMYDIG